MTSQREEGGASPDGSGGYSRDEVVAAQRRAWAVEAHACDGQVAQDGVQLLALPGVRGPAGAGAIGRRSISQAV